MLEDPRVNFAISQRGRQTGVNHLGFQVEDDAELKAMRGQLEAADAGLLEQTNAACCYALSEGVSELLISSQMQSPNS
jgi:hypothetical protein